MNMKKLALAAAVLGVIVLATVVIPSAATGDEEVLRQVRDRQQIEDLMWRYTRALDSQNADAYAAIYTADGQFSSGATPTKGRDALRKMVADLRERRDKDVARGVKPAPMFHMTANERVQFIDKDHARVEAYYLTAFGAVGQDTPLRVAAVGRSVDDLVRVNDQWLIKSRNVSPQD
jgi:uncharacterized protein (TIGR02246 family)